MDFGAPATFDGRVFIESGLIDSDERRMLTGALPVTQRVVREVMTARRRLVTIDAATPIAEALAEFSVSPYSRFPVTEDGEEIVGLVTLRDLFLANERGTAATVADVAEEPMVVSEVFEVGRLYKIVTPQMAVDTRSRR